MAEFEKIPVPTNEYGVVIPPPVHDCVGESCKFRGDNPDCGYNSHHLHSSEPFYDAAGGQAAEFRGLSVLRVWMHWCQHKEHHDTHEVDVPIPSLEVMRQGVEEARRLRDVEVNDILIHGTNLNITHPQTTRRMQTGLYRHRDELMKKRENLLKGVNDFEVIPEELVTGALLVVAPNHARSKMFRNSDFALTGTMPRYKIPTALDSAKEFKEWVERKRALQTGVDEVQLAA